jgi:peptidyl-prolyl cis-trans isomerase A (cyclophilin A)
MTHRILLGLFAGLLLSATTRADVLPLQFDDTLPPTVPNGDSVFPTTIPCGKSLIIPVAASNPNGGTLVYSATSNNPAIMVRVRTGNPVLSLGISHTPAATGTDIAVSGTLQLMLFRDFAPITAGIIGGMAQGKFYDGVTFHRIAPGFMAQGGDPGNDQRGLGFGGPGFSFDNEFKLSLIFTGKGQLAMANSGYSVGKGTNGSQFFITYDACRKLQANGDLAYNLDFKHSIFGQLLRGWDTLYSMSQLENYYGNPLNGYEGDPNDPNNPYQYNARPMAPVTITSAKLIKTNDAVLYLSATGVGNANITVTISDPVSGAAPVSKTFAVNSAVDNYNFNDPAILVPPSDSVVPLKGKATVILQTQDLEFDHPVFDVQFLSATNGVGSSSGPLGKKLTISGNPSTFSGPLDVWVKASEANATSWEGQAVFSVRIGDKALIPQPAAVAVKTGTGTIIAGGFLDKDSTAQASGYTATINWGDGAVSSGSDAIVSRDPKAGSSAKFLVSGTHAYNTPGIYPLYVEVKAAGGTSVEPLTKIYGTATVAAGDLLAQGQAISSKGGNLSKKQVATFQDASPLASGSYKTVIDWGDGATSSGTVAKLSGSTSFKVLGTHRYADSCNYSINVSISKPNETVNAWSTASVKVAAPPFLPPVPQAPLGGALSSGTFAITTSSGPVLAMSGTMVIRNLGNKKSLPATLQFLLSKNGSLSYDQVSVIKYLGKDFLSIPALAPGAEYKISMSYQLDSTQQHITKHTLLLLPFTSATGQPEALIYYLNWSDPLADLSPIQRVFGLWLYQ